PRESLDDVRPNIIRFLTLQGIDDLLEVLRERYPVTRVAGQAPSALRTTEPAVVTPEAID
ncbi:MAG TPA: peptidylprolyl isomerase, partial [Oceanicaulis sp.]|nr:peptidylprolyl isomerase [Oceanicaulis sp.]